MIQDAGQAKKTAFAAMVDALVQMHRLSRSGKFESAEAEAIRDSTEEPWNELSDAQRRRFVELSADLNSLEQNLHERKPSDVSPQALQDAHEAGRTEDWDRALATIREADPRATSPVALYFRGTAWAALGFEDVAIIYFDRAAELAPDEPRYRAARLLSSRKNSNL